MNNQEDSRKRAATMRDLQQRNRELQRSLEAANKELDDLIYSVAHDLRAPLTHLDGFSQLLLDSASGTLSGEDREHLGRIIDASRHMHELIAALLEYSRLNRAPLAMGEQDLEELLEQALSAAAPLAAGRNIQWQRSRLPRVRGDAGQLQQVLAVLIANAIKYTRGRTPAVIEVGARQGEQGETVVFVRDNGVGFDLKYAQRLFTPFQRMHSAEAFQGIGMGLATAQRILARHGGTIRVETAPGAGATFFVSLPGVAEE